MSKATECSRTMASTPARVSIALCRISVCRIAFVCGVCWLALGTVQAQDKFEGAVWKFSMKPQTPGQSTLKGQFRVNNHQLFQKSMPQSPDFDRLIGTNGPSGKKTVITLTDARAMDKNRKWHNGIKGKVLLTMDRFGKWSGRLIDSEGRHWEFHCARVQE